MNKIFFVFLAFIFSTGIVFARENSPLATKVIKAMEEKEVTIVDMSVEYRQLITYFSTGENQSSRGEIKIKDNNIFVFQKFPQRRYTYIDGEKMTTYVPANKQALVENWKDILENDVVIATALNFSKNYKRDKKEYYVNLILQTDREYCLLIKSVKETQTWKLYLNVDVETFLVNSSIFENNNFKIEINLSDYKLNTGLNEGIFQFNCPKDVELVEL